MKRTAHLHQSDQQSFQWKSAMASLGVAFICLSSPNSASAADTSLKAGTLDATSCSKPVWPQEALAAKRTGTVTMKLLIGSDGKVKKSVILKSSGYEDLDVAARDGIAKCTFRPGLLEGKPAEAWLMLQYAWTLD